MSSVGQNRKKALMWTDARVKVKKKKSKVDALFHKKFPKAIYEESDEGICKGEADVGVFVKCP